jgi:GT2 family glycosyltransferase
VDRWRGRHLFKEKNPPTIRHKTSLITWGTIVRKSIVLEAGNYNKHLCHSEDFDLGKRLLQRGYDVIFDPNLKVLSNSSDTIWQVLDRYWRWYVGKDEEVSIKGYLKAIVYSVKVMAIQDFNAGDPLSIMISLFSPHYNFWRTLWRKFKGG